jgi:hypothetical protein
MSNAIAELGWESGYHGILVLDERRVRVSVIPLCVFLHYIGGGGGSGCFFFVGYDHDDDHCE